MTSFTKIMPALVSIVALSAVGHKLDSSLLHFGESKQFFFDNLIIESVQNLTRRVHRPVKVGTSPLIKKDKPWEHVAYFSVSTWNVIRDPQDGIFKCWYEDWKYKTLQKPGDELHDPVTRPSRYLYARSQDGIHWEKPVLGIVQEGGHDTNVVFGDEKFGSVHSGFVFLDTLEKRPEHRFKMIFNHRAPGLGRGRYEIASSPDGIRWTAWNEPSNMGWLGPHLGDVVTISIAENARIYRLNTRHPRMLTVAAHPGDPFHSTFVRPYYPEDFSRQNKRRVFRADSADLINWSNLVPLLVADDNLDNLDDALYGLTQLPVGDNWVGFLHVFHMTENTMDVQLLFSRDGTHFQRVQPGQPWLERGAPGSWDSLLLNINGTPVVYGDELYIYYGAASNHHDWWIVGDREGLDVPEARDRSLVNYALGLARLKLDRFVSLTALPVREGILVTRPFHSEGTKLYLNARCREGGYVRVAVTDSNGKIVPGFEAERCNVFQGDEVSYNVTWESRRELPLPPGEQLLKLQFFMRDADLFSFQLRK